MAATKVTPRNPEAYKIYFYIPNLIGYLRVFLSLLSFFIYESYPGTVIVIYTTSFVLDGLDGIAARHYNQCSRFGAVLDMVTDRFSTAALVTILSNFYPNYTPYFVLLNILDFVSHWFRMYVSLVIGTASHKDVDWDRSYLLALYYTNKTFMAILCVGNELFYVFLYAIHFYQLSQLWLIIALALLVPTWAGKQLMNFIQMYCSANELVEFEYEKDSHHKKN
ncbi:predicted protein [Naegleria gruberi]|uniref:CDP-diacylglycerol--inositol 3-phosphatidyltransferase n=1 Tax=Naegleria gruberi TaxID=5762 RepID=D2VUQ2_NAEGR|nr:uncharacterized protein NAEGRDRAFT_72744 [Naegleria gruberi]EFC39547.1 predicted protein [Naegleria gruberi]|eukprot:XP_002672291.1 predicted protein [Naegleria gruberi strain NEG-M]